MGWGGLFGALGTRCWLFETYFALSVRAGGCLVQGFEQFGVHLGWQNSCSAIWSAFFSNFDGIL